MSEPGYVLFVSVFIGCWVAWRSMAEQEKKFDNATWKLPKALKLFFPKECKAVTLHNLVFMILVTVSSICLQILFIYWWIVGYTGEATDIPLAVLVGMYLVFGCISMANCYLDYRRKSEFMRRKNRYKF